MRILVIEDHASMAESLKASLEAERHAVDIENDGERGSYRARTTDYDLILLDNALPGKQGRDICRELREYKMTTPILVLSGMSEVEEKVALLDCGADDYLTKPFSFKELYARVNALLRRPNVIEEETLSVADLSLNRKDYSVLRAGKPVYLTAKEFSFLEYLMKNQGTVLGRGDIIEHVWDKNGDLFSNAIETHMANLRRKIDRGHSNQLIHTIPGRGYMIAAS